MGSNQKGYYHKVARMIAETIANEHSHAYSKHHLKNREFTDPKMGEPQRIRSAQSLVEHAYMVLTSQETRTVHTRGNLIYAYHPPSNTVCIINPNARDKDGGTVYRMNKDVDGHGEWHAKLTKYEARVLGVTGFKDAGGGLISRLFSAPHLAPKLEASYAETKMTQAQIARAARQKTFCENIRDITGKKKGRHQDARTFAYA